MVIRFRYLSNHNVYSRIIPEIAWGGWLDKREAVYFWPQQWYAYNDHILSVGRVYYFIISINWTLDRDVLKLIYFEMNYEYIMYNTLHMFHICYFRIILRTFYIICWGFNCCWSYCFILSKNSFPKNKFCISLKTTIYALYDQFLHFEKTYWKLICNHIFCWIHLKYCDL